MQLINDELPLSEEQIDKFEHYNAPITTDIPVAFDELLDMTWDELLDNIDNKVFSNKAWFLNPTVTIAGNVTSDEIETGQVVVRITGFVSTNPEHIAESVIRKFERAYPDDELRVGYRDDDLFGDHVTNPIDVLEYEICELGNEVWLSDLLELHGHKLNAITRHDLSDLAETVLNGDEPDDTQKAALKAALTAILEGRDFCKWLCTRPADVFDAYVSPFAHTADYTERMQETCVQAYMMPMDAMPLTHSEPNEGILMAWHRRETDND